MKKILKLLVATSLIFATTTVSAFAQSYEATAGTISDDVDYALDTRYYKEANVKDFLVKTYVQNGLGVDFAKQLDKLYIGGSYSGNLLGSINSTTNNNSSKYQNKNRNNFNMLFGFNNMAISVKLHLDSNINKEKENNTGIKINNSIGLGFGAGWGGSFNKEKFIFKPYITIYDDFNVVKKAPKPTGNYKKYNNFSLGLGTDFVFGDKADLYSIFGVSYSLNLPIHKTFDINDNLIKTEYGKNNDYIDNAFYLSYLVNKRFNEKLDIGAKVNLGTHIQTYKNDENGTIKEDNFVYGLGIGASIGAKYHCIPKVFNINAGVKVDLPDLQFSKENITNKETFETMSYWGGSFNTGIEWTPFNNFTIDTNVNFYCGQQFRSTFDSLSIGLSYRK